jgi:hypothetical protein
MYEFDRIPQKTYVYGIRLTDKNISVTKEYLKKNKFVKIFGENYKAIMVFDADSESIAAFFVDPQKDQNIIDNKIISESNSWNAFTGQPLSEKGKSLEPIPVITAYWFAWFNFFPNTELIN